MKAALTLLIIGAIHAFAAEKMVKEVASLSPTDRVVMELPERFRYDVTEQPDDMFRPALRLRSLGADGISSLRFKIFVGKNEKGQLTDQKELDSAVEKMSADYVDGSVEKASQIQHLQNKDGVGAFCVFTDADLAAIPKLRPGQFRHITLGLVRIEGYVFIVRGYSNTKEDEDFKAVLRVLENLKVEKKEREDLSKKDA